MTDLWLRGPQTNNNDVRLTDATVIDLIDSSYTNTNYFLSQLLVYQPYLFLKTGVSLSADVQLINPSTMNQLLGSVIYDTIRFMDANIFSRTNYVENSLMSGVVDGSPGTLPTYWTDSATTGLTRTITHGTG